MNGYILRQYSPEAKGYKVKVSWREVHFENGSSGLGLFADEDIAKGQVIREGKEGENV